jgi:hypothetical protein
VLSVTTVLTMASAYCTKVGGYKDITQNADTDTHILTIYHVCVCVEEVRTHAGIKCDIHTYAEPVLAGSN